VAEWLDNPVTRLHRERLEIERSDLINDAALRGVVGGSLTAEEVGMRTIGHVNKADGIATAYDREDMYSWLLEAVHD